MGRSGRKAGISMVALVITIIVLIVLTSAVVITGAGAPKQAQLAVFKSNVATIQDAVTMKMGNNMITGALEGKNDAYKWLGIVKDYEGTSDIDFTNGEIIAGEFVLPLSTELRSIVKISEEELANYYVSEDGIVYHIGFESNGITYYNNNVAGGTYTMTELMADASKGTQGATITISTPQELKDLATYTNDGNTTKGVIFKLMNDININEGTTVQYEKQTGLVKISYGANEYSIGTGVDTYIGSNGIKQTIANVSVKGEIRNSENEIISEIPNIYEWTPIGTPTHIINPEDSEKTMMLEDIKWFMGIFDGQNKTVSGIYIHNETIFNQALFGNNKGVIQNLNVDNSYIYSERLNNGGIVGRNMGTIESCNNNGAIVCCGNDWSNNGGIVGWTSGTIRNCTNNVVLVGNVAGITGYAYYTTVYNCYNYADIYGAAGIIKQINTSTVVNCANYGNIVTSINKYVGGICGLFSSYAPTGGNVINCYNMGSVYCDVSSTGGVVGQVDGTDNNIYNCYNLGTVNGKNTGGVVGRATYEVVVLSNLYNTGTIMGSNYVGDVVGRISIEHASNIYAKTNRYFGSYTTLTGTGIISANNTITVGSEEIHVIKALNNWVEENKTAYPKLKYWNWDSTNNRPMFTDNRPSTY